MKEKTVFRIFTIYEHEKEQDYLRQMHRSGWKFCLLTFPGFYHFEECEPEDVVYQLDYNPEGLSHKEEYVKLFEDCGWEYLQDFAGYSYFRKPASETAGAEEIFCDEDSRLQMLGRVFKGRLLPIFIILVGVMLPQFLLNLFSYRDYPAAAAIGVMTALCIGAFIRFAWLYYTVKTKRKN